MRSRRGCSRREEARLLRPEERPHGDADYDADDEALTQFSQNDERRNTDGRGWHGTKGRRTERRARTGVRVAEIAQRCLLQHARIVIATCRVGACLARRALPMPVGMNDDLSRGCSRTRFADTHSW